MIPAMKAPKIASMPMKSVTHADTSVSRKHTMATVRGGGPTFSPPICLTTRSSAARTTVGWDVKKVTKDEKVRDNGYRRREWDGGWRCLDTYPPDNVTELVWIRNTIVDQTVKIAASR